MPEYSSHTFTKGMNKDIDLSLLDTSSYLHAENLRLSTEYGKTEGSLENILGNSSFIDGSGTPLEDNLDVPYIAGYTNIRNKMYLFCTPSVGSFFLGNDYIYELEVNDDGTYQNFRTVYTGTLNLSMSNPIKAVGRYETSTIQKIYWVDGYNELRVINVADPNVSSLTVDQLSILPNADLTSPSGTKIISGNIPTGKIQYAYQFFNDNGSESAYSPTSGLYSLTKSNYYEADTGNFRGTSADEDANSGVVVELLTDSNYDKVRLIALFYETLNSLPTIRIVTEENTISSGNIIISDVGQSIGELTLEEFRILSTTVFSAKEIATKNNRLFVGNIEEQSFDVTYDARAYRFNNSSTARIYQSDLVTYTDITSSNWGSVDSDHDAINLFNNPDYQKNASYQYKYTEDGLELGGEGPNVKYTFDNRVIRLDSDTTSLYNKVDQSVTSYQCYAGFDISADDVSYQDDEVYRFAVILTDDRGRRSEPKWIGDVAFPSRTEDPNYTICNYESGFERSTAAALTIVFTFSNLPSDVVSVEVVRAKREEQDRRIIAQGLISGAYSVAIDGDNYLVPGVTPGYFGGSTGRQPLFVNFISPEISFGNNIPSDTSAWFEAVQVLHDTETFDETDLVYNTDLNDGFILKYKGAEALYDTTYGERVGIESFNILDSSSTNWDSTDGVISMGTGATRYIPYAYSNSGVSGEGGRFAKSAICQTDIWFPYYLNEISASYDTYLVNYKRNVFQGQYGGISYEARQNTEYISTGYVLDKVGSSAAGRVLGGDTYINMFDCLYVMYDTDQNQVDNSKCFMSVVYFPVSSSINLDFRHDEGFKTNTDTAGQYLIQETAGVYQNASGDSFTFNKDYYLYNTVYSQENVANVYTPTVNESEDTSDVRVLYSDEKTNGELTDSWTKFRTNAFLDIDSTYGSLQNLEVFKNELLFWQDKAFGVLSVNPRSLIQDGNVGQLVLGTGDVLDRYDYISTDAGNLSRYGIIKSNDSLYWYDSYNTAIYKYSGQLVPESKIKGLDNYFDKEIKNDYKLIGTYDHKYNEVLFTFITDDAVYNPTNKSTILYNEKYGIFVSFFDTNPVRYLKANNNKYIGLTFPNPVYGQPWTAYIYNQGAYNTIDGMSSIQSKLTVSDNSNWGIQKVYDTIVFTTRSGVYSSYEYGTDDYDDTFSTFQAWNDYQNTDEWTLTFQASKDNTSKILPIDRRERSWEISIPRDAVTGSNMFTSLDTTKLFSQRIRSNYLITNWKYNNTASNKLNISNMIFSYRVSKR